MVAFDQSGYIDANLQESEENVVNRFLQAGQAETRTLADIIMEKLRANESNTAKTDFFSFRII